jgi:CRISPR-associated protein Cas1
MDESLWPARNVAEHAYCPRLFYLMEVEGIHVPNADTQKGVAIHKRVDRPSSTHDGATNDAGDPDRPKAVRSLTLTSKRLGLTATLDLAEITGMVAVPVEYRKGRPKHNGMLLTDDPGESDEPPAAPAEPWPTDRVQVGLQAILLEEAGYTVPEAVLYYAAERRRLRIPVDAALKEEALATLDAAKQTAQGPRPLPLINDSRCVRCSLQPVCLPDEVNHQRDEPVKPRRIWPPRDDGIHVVAQVNGTKVGVRGMAVRITDKDGAVLKEFPIVSLESLSLLGSVQISTQAVQALAEKSIPIAYLSPAGRLIAIINPVDSVSAEVRRQQARKFDTTTAKRNDGHDQPEYALQLTRALVAAKITNQRTLLLRNHASLPSAVAADLVAEAEKAARATSIDAVRGHEGQAAAIYFAHYAGIFKSKLAQEFDVNGRQRRPPPDPINSCLSMAYTMLTHECVASLRLASLEPSIGAFHASRPGRPALALDLMEPFRPLIADSITISAFNRGELTEGHFLRTAAGCVLTDAGRRAFFDAYGRRLETEVTHPVFQYRLSYRRMLVLHARMIAAWLLGEVPSLAFLTTR